LINEEANRPFDLARGPLLRATLLRVDENEYAALFTMHHIVSDGWSMGVLVREIAALYEAYSSGQGSSLPLLPIQYADFAVWQRQWLQGEVLEQQLAYWKACLSDMGPRLNLPTKRRSTTTLTFRGMTQRFVLSKDLLDSLDIQSRQEGVTPYMMLLSAYQMLLYHYTGQDDIVIGTPVANRNRIEIETLIGFFVNTLVLRTSLSGNPGFRELLARVREVTLGAFANQDLPFDILVKELQPERTLSRTSLFQTSFALQNAPMSSLEIPGLTLSPMKIETETARFELSLLLAEMPDGLYGSFEYNTDLFEAGTITKMIRHYEIILDTVVEQPDIRLNEMSGKLRDSDRQQRINEAEELEAASLLLLKTIRRKSTLETKDAAK
jgi:hypothetical protein